MAVSFRATRGAAELASFASIAFLWRFYDGLQKAFMKMGRGVTSPVPVGIGFRATGANLAQRGCADDDYGISDELTRHEIKKAA